MKVLDAAGARALDERTIAGGTPGILLMERAASAVSREVLRAVLAVPLRGRRVVVLAGTGNNGGDGFEVARLLRGLPGVGAVRTLVVGDPARLAGDARTTWGRLVAAGAETAAVADETGLEPIARASLVVDALFGTGLSRPLAPDGLPARALARIPRGAFVVAVDLPSGLDASRAEVIGPAPRCDVSVTFGTPKTAHLLPPAAAFCGRIVVADIGLGMPEGEAPEAVVARDLLPLFPRRAAETNKGTYGKVAIVGGSEPMAGAACLAAVAAHRTGAGLVTAVARGSVRSVVHAVSPESTTAVPTVDFGLFDALAVGPGLGTSDEARRDLDRALAAEQPAVFDADALNMAAGEPERFASRRAPTVLTPHPGEAGRLLSKGPKEVNADRDGAAREIARRANAVVVLKGFRSVVAAPDGRVATVLTGNPGMATGGMGDVLTGVVGALLARGFSAWDAARAGAWLHGAAGDLAAERLGEESLRARDVADELPGAFRLVAESES